MACEIITSPERFAEVADLHSISATPFGFDFETRGVKLETAAVVGLAISSVLGDYYIALGHHAEMRDPWGGAMWDYDREIAEYDHERTIGLPPSVRKYKTKPKKPARITFEAQIANLPRDPRNMDPALVWPIFGRMFTGKTGLRIAHNLPFDWRVARREFLKYKVAVPAWPEKLCDSLILAYSLSIHLRHAYGGLDLNTVSGKILGEKKDEEMLDSFFESRKVVAKSLQKTHLWCAPLEAVAFYACKDASLARALAKKLLPVVWADEGAKRMYDRELALVQTTVAMEMAPKWVNHTYATTTHARGQGKLDELKADVYRHAGKEFDLDSPEQLGNLLREAGLKLPLSEGTQKAFDAGKEPKKILYATDAKTLESYRHHKVVKAILRYRALSKRIHTDLKGILEYSHALKSRPGLAVLYPNLSQTTARTGRYGSSKPNGQNQTRDDENDEWAKDFSVRRAMTTAPRNGAKCKSCGGRGNGPNCPEGGGPMPCLHCGGAGKSRRVTIFVDLKQIEPRWTAHLSRDKNMIAVYQEGRDIYVEIGKYAFKLDEALEDKAWKKAHPDERQAAKAIVLAITYGAGTKKVAWMVEDAVLSVVDGRLSTIARKLAEDPSEEEAEKLVAEAALLRHKQKTFRFSVEDAQAVMYRVEERFPGIFAYRDYLEAQYKRNGFIRNPFGRKLYLAFEDKTYTLLNAMVQSSAADMLKQATLDSHLALEAAGLDAHLIFSVHDELILDSSAEDAWRAIEIVRKEMTKFELRVPLDVDLAAAVGSWADAVEFSVKDGIPWSELAPAA